MDTIREPARDIPVVAEAEVLVVGGGSAGVCAAVAAARNGAETLLLERYGYLGGDATGSMVIVLDDMTDGKQVTVGGLAQESIDRLDAMGAAVYPPEEDRWVASAQAWAKWKNWGFMDLYSRVKPPKPIVYSVTFDPDALKMVCLDMLKEAGVKIRLHSWVVGSIVEDGVIRGVIVESKAGRHAIRGQIVIDASGDGDVYATAGANSFTTGTCSPSSTAWPSGHGPLGAFRGRESAGSQAHQRGHAEDLRRLVGRVVAQDRPRRRRLVQLPHFHGLDGLKVEDLTFVEIEGRRRSARRWRTRAPTSPASRTRICWTRGPRSASGRRGCFRASTCSRRKTSSAGGGSTTASAAGVTTTCRTDRCCRWASRTCWSRDATIRRRRKPSGRAGRSRLAKSWGRPRAPPRRSPPGKDQPPASVGADAPGDAGRPGGDPGDEE